MSGLRNGTRKLLVRETHPPWPHLGISTAMARVSLRTTSVRSSCTSRAGPWETLTLDSTTTSAHATSSAAVSPRTTWKPGGSTRWHQPKDADATEGLNRLDQKLRSECPLLGKRVVITGTSREDLNGRAGVATSFDHDSDRYVVELDDSAGEKEKAKLKLKPGNLVLVGTKQRKGRGE